MRSKLKDASGLTLVEMLCGTVILVLLCLVMNTGMHAALAEYRTLTSEAETRLLLSSLSDALTDKLRYCVVYTDKTTGAYKRCSIGEIDASSGKLIIKETDATGVPVEKPLLPEGAYGELIGAERKYKVTVEAGSFTPDITAKDPADPESPRTATFKIKLTVEETTGSISSKTPEEGLVIRCLNPVRKEEGTTP